MGQFLLKRLLLLLVTLFGIALISFVFITMAPGDPASLKAGGMAKGQSTGINTFTIRKNKELFFLDRPIILNTDPATRRSVVTRTLAELDSTVELEREDAKIRLVSAMGTAALDGLVEELEQAAAAAAAERTRREEHLDALPGAEGPTLADRLQTLAEHYPAFEPRLAGEDGRPPEPARLAEVWLNQRRTLLDDAERKARLVLRILSSTPAWEGEVAGIKAAGAGGPAVAEETPLSEAAHLWQAWWAEHRGEYTPERARAVAEAWLAQGDDAARAGLLAVGQLTAPALMEALRDADPGSEREQRAGAGLSLVCKKPWTLARDEDGRKRWRAEWEEQTQALEERRETMHPSAYARRQAELGSADDYVAAREAEAFAERRDKWADWWYRTEEYYVDFTPSQQAWRGITQTQFGRWMSRLARLDFGESYKQKRPVSELLAERLPITLVLNGISLALVYLIALPIGIFSATHKDSLADRASTLLLFLLYSVPSFWAGAMLLMLFTGEPFFDLFPAYGYKSLDADQLSFGQQLVDYAKHIVLPVLCLTYAQVAYVSKQMRAGMLDVVRQDFIRTARAKGLSEGKVIYKHALRNGLIPVLTLMGSLLPLMFGGSVIIESIFTIEGMGKLAFQAILDRDYPVIMANLVISGFLTLLGILITDVAYALVDPRIEFR